MICMDLSALGADKIIFANFFRFSEGEKEGAHPRSAQTQKLRKALEQVNKSYFEASAM